MSSQYQNEFELHARAILGLPVSIKMNVEAAASAVIYGAMDAKGIAFEGLDIALQDAQTDLRLFGKPEAFERRRMGVALAYSNNTNDARRRAGHAAEQVKPIKE